MVVFLIRNTMYHSQHNIQNGILCISGIIIEIMKVLFTLDGLIKKIHIISIVLDIILFNNFSFTLLKIISTHHTMVMLLKLKYFSVREHILQQ